MPEKAPGRPGARAAMLSGIITSIVDTPSCGFVWNRTPIRLKFFDLRASFRGPHP
jgi:hypothetical protein